MCFYFHPPSGFQIYLYSDFGSMLVGWFTFTGLVLDAAKTVTTYLYLFVGLALVFVLALVKALSGEKCSIQIESDSKQPV